VTRSTPAVAAFAAELPARARIVAANVAGTRMAEQLEALVAARPGSSLEFVATTAERFGVRCAYADPSRLGVDRWVAVLSGVPRGTRRRVRHRCRHLPSRSTPSTPRGAHLGGLIFRARASRRRRSTATPATSGARPRCPPSRAGSSFSAAAPTPAVGHAAWLALSSALDRAVATVERALGARPVVYLTGGDAQALHGWLETASSCGQTWCSKGSSCSPTRRRVDAASLSNARARESRLRGLERVGCPSARGGRPADEGLPALTLVSEVPADLRSEQSEPATQNAPAQPAADVAVRR
jgi:type III pantothenate kinase